MYLIALSSLIACNNLGESDNDATTESNNSGGVYGALPGSDEESEDPVDTASDDTASTGGDTADSGSSDTGTDVVETVDAYIVIFPAAEWEASLDTAGSPVVYMYETANYTSGDWDGYGDTTDYASGTSDDGVVIDSETFTPGDILVVGAAWWDGYSWRFFADSGNTVRSESDDWDDDGDVEMVAVVIYDNDTYDVYEIDSTGVDTSQAYYVDSGSGHDVYVQTSLNVTGEYTL